jgi:signal transduction histidine kinase
MPAVTANQTLFERVADPIFGVGLLCVALMTLRQTGERRLLIWKVMSFLLALYILGSFAAKLAAGGNGAILSITFLMWLPAVVAFGGLIMPFAARRRMGWLLYAAFALVALAWLAWGVEGGGAAGVNAARLARELQINAFLSLAILLLLIGEIGRNLQAALRAATLARQVAEQANRAKSEFLARMSHDLRTPLNVVIGYSEVISGEMLGGPEVWPRYRDYADHVRESGEFLLALVNDILDIARIDAGGFALKPEPLDLDALVMDIVSRLSQMAAGQGVILICAQVGMAGTVMVDRRALEQALQNLVSNAITFTPRGKRVGVRTARTGDSVLIDVWDEGIGIDAADLPHLGEPFRRFGRPEDADHHGTGLGVALVKNILRLLGGTVAFVSAPGTGTTARVTLPVQMPGISPD